MKPEAKTVMIVDEDMIKAYLNYANSYLVKPLDFDKFERMTEHFGYYWLVWNQHPWRGESKGRNDE